MKNAGPGLGRKRERGQALVEFTLTAPVLLVLLIGLVELGSAFNSYLTVVAAARDAARLGAQGGAGETEMRALIDVETDRLNPPLDANASACSGDPGVCVTSVSLGSPPTPSYRVRVCYDHPLITSGFGFIPDPIRMCSKTTMRVKPS